MNKCARCKKDKPRSEFGADKRNKSGLQSACKECDKSRVAKANNKKETVKPSHTDFMCAKCEITKLVSEFYKNNTKKGHDSTCITCRLNKVRRSESVKEPPKPAKEPLKPKEKIWASSEAHNDNVNGAREASAYDLSIAMLVKIGDDRRFKKGLERIKKSGVVKNAHIARPAYSFKNGVWSVVAEIRADGVLFPYQSQNFISKEVAEEHLNHVRENAKQIIESKVKGAA